MGKCDIQIASLDKIKGFYTRSSQYTPKTQVCTALEYCKNVFLAMSSLKSIISIRTLNNLSACFQDAFWPQLCLSNQYEMFCCFEWTWARKQTNYPSKRKEIDQGLTFWSSSWACLAVFWASCKACPIDDSAFSLALFSSASLLLRRECARAWNQKSGHSLEVMSEVCNIGEILWSVPFSFI